MAADPSYPFNPIINIIAAVLLSLVLLSNAVRRNWNFGLTSLCFWVLLEALTNGIGTIIWSDNADIRLYGYCDIVSRVQLVALVVKSVAIFILMRRLHKIASLQTVEMHMREANRRELLLDWTLGFIIPVLVAGPLYYVVEPTRFQLIEGFGCTNIIVSSVLSILMLELWGVVPPLLCVILYYPRVVRVFYQQSKDVRRFRNGSTSPFRTTYFRLLAIASIDLLLTLPIGVSNLVLAILASLQNADQLRLPFYQGWTVIHQYFELTPGTLYADLKDRASYNLVELYFLYWTTPILAISIFGLFGLTAEAKASYWRVLNVFSSPLGWKLRVTELKRDNRGLESMEFGVPPQETVLDAEMGSFPGFITFTPTLPGQGP